MGLTATPADLDDDLTMIVARAVGRDVKVQSVTREPSPFMTLFPADVLTLTLSDGHQARLFLKHLGPEQTNHPDKPRRDREVRVYARLLNRRDDLPVPRYFGSRFNGSTARHELYLEYIDDWSLRYQDLEHWFTAAQRLADLHAHFAARAQELGNADFLLKLDQHYFAAWADRAQSAVNQQSPQLADDIQQVRDDFGPACDLLANQPVTLVHNDLACKNIIADRSSTPARICIIDWELAGVGCGLLDLVHLKYGLDPVNDAKMISTYRARLGCNDLLPKDDREFSRLLAACELHKTLYRLAHSPAWKLPLEKLAQWVGEAQTFLQTVLTR